jgi:two-component system cell cycle sensor histidine kinase/response regulator CckA
VGSRVPALALPSTRGGSERIDLIPDPFRRLGRLLEALLAAADIDLVLEVDPELKRCRLHTDILHELVLELVKNAVDALQRGGRIDLRGTVTTIAHEDRHPVMPRGTYLRLEVEDNGSGIAPEIEERVFDPFFTTKGMAAAQGRGLPFVYGRVKGRGGYINLDTMVGVGTAVRLYLPLEARDVVD